MIHEITLALIPAVTGGLAVYLLMPWLIKRLREKGIVGVDVHKLDKPKIPEMGGLGVIFGLIMAFTCLLLLPLSEGFKVKLSCAFFSVFIAALVGAVDDLVRLGAKEKPLLTLLCAIPILIAGVYNPKPTLPFIGRVRLTLVYPVLIPVFFSVFTNAVNMLDIANGLVPLTCSETFATLFVCSLILGSVEGACLSLIYLALLLGYYRYNRYPAKVFSGDVGSLAIGAMIASIAIVGSLEVVVVVAMFPYIMNGFHLLVTLGGLYERSEISRPTRLGSDGRIYPVLKGSNYIPLAKAIVVKEPLTEKELIAEINAMQVLSCLMAFITCLLEVVTLGL